MNRIIIIGLALLCLLAGCGQGGEGDSAAPSSSVPPSPAPPSSPFPSAPAEQEQSAAPPPSSSVPKSEPPAGSSAGGESGSVSSAPAAPAILTLTVPEGYTLARIGMTLEDMGVCTAEEFIEASQTADVSAFPLLALPRPDTNRCFRLEGYLFPDSYQIYDNAAPEEIIRTMLSHLESRITPELRAQVEQSGYSFDEILALASIIEKEAFGAEHMPAISSVLHNRLEQGMRLQCDVTITYVEGAIKPFITGDKDRYSADYNTYKCEGIPAGAIANPGIAAIRAALSPADTDYLFFVTDQDRQYHFSATWEQHEANVKRIEQEKLSASSQP